MRLKVHVWAWVVVSVSGVGVGVEARHRHEQKMTDGEVSVRDRPDLCCGSFMPQVDKTSTQDSSRVAAAYESSLNTSPSNIHAYPGPVFNVKNEARTLEIRQIIGVKKSRDQHNFSDVSDNWRRRSQNERPGFTSRKHQSAHTAYKVLGTQNSAWIPVSRQRPPLKAADRHEARHRFRSDVLSSGHNSVDTYTSGGLRGTVAHSERGDAARTYHRGSQAHPGRPRTNTFDNSNNGKERSEATGGRPTHRMNHKNSETSKKTYRGSSSSVFQNPRGNHQIRELYRGNSEASPAISSLAYHRRLGSYKQANMATSKSYLADSPNSHYTGESPGTSASRDHSSSQDLDSERSNNLLRATKRTSNEGSVRSHEDLRYIPRDNKTSNHGIHRADENRASSISSSSSISSFPSPVSSSSNSTFNVQPEMETPEKHQVSDFRETNSMDANDPHMSRGYDTSRLDIPDDDIETRMDIPDRCCGSKIPLDLDNAIAIGGLSRVSSAGSFKVVEIPAVDTDHYPPVHVRDLRVEPLNPFTISLTWTTPGDDLDYGTASDYVIRLSDDRNDLQESQFDQAPERTLLSTSEYLRAADVYQVAGTEVRVGIPLQVELQKGNVYYVALRAVDDHGNTSPVSNLARFSIPLPSLEWLMPSERQVTMVEGSDGDSEAAAGHRILGGSAGEGPTTMHTAHDASLTRSPEDHSRSSPEFTEPNVNVAEPTEPSSGLPEPTEPVFIVTEPTEPGLRVREPTEPGLRMTEPTEPGLRVREPTEPGLRVREPTEPGLRVREPTEPGLRVREPTEPGLRVREPTEPGLRLREPTEPGLRVREPTEPGLRVRESTEPGLRVREPTEPGLHVREPTEPGLRVGSRRHYLTTDARNAHSLPVITEDSQNRVRESEERQTQQGGRGKKERRDKSKKTKKTKRKDGKKQKRQRGSRNQEDSSAISHASNTNPYEGNECFLEEVEDPGPVSLCDARYSLTIVISYFEQNADYQHLDYLSAAMHSLEQKTRPLWQKERRNRRRRRRGWKSSPPVNLPKS
nr:uncharacterized protein LOC128695321 isoform X2 [Cherax quadricarinatus]XP_053641813.1 uncharacterized protein LOC128695321 isoform X2 [Cherax quadricarinatus]